MPNHYHHDFGVLIDQNHFEFHGFHHHNQGRCPRTTALHNQLQVQDWLYEILNSMNIYEILTLKN